VIEQGSLPCISGPAVGLLEGWPYLGGRFGIFALFGCASSEQQRSLNAPLALKRQLAGPSELFKASSRSPCGQKLLPDRYPVA